MSDPKAIINLGDLAKPADTLIKKISAAIGILYEPKRIIRKARAEAEAEKIRALAEIEVKDIQRRALVRFISEETRKQLNIEGIISKALPEVSETAKPEIVEDDWISNFFDKAKLISDEDMQRIWARILSGEANQPGTFSKKTINILSSLDKRDAILFTRLCSFAFLARDFILFIYDIARDGIYSRYSITFDALTHLDSIGLLRFETLTGFRKKAVPEVMLINYYGKAVRIKFPGKSDNSFPYGCVMLTRPGQELVRICAAVGSDEILEFVIGKWLDSGLIVSSNWPKN